MTSVPDRSHLTILADETALAHALAGHVVALGRDAIARRGRFDLALAGGTTPKAAYRLLATDLRDALDWSKVRFFFGDERCVPPDDEQSNYRMARLALLEPLDIADSTVARMHGEDEPTSAAHAYATALTSSLEPDETGVPRFDLLLLGMGPDGHTASLFPGSNPYDDDAALVRAPYVAKFGTHRLTLTPKAINAARAIAVTTGGAAKAAALAAVFRPPVDPATYPIAVLAPRDGDLRWFVDREAAAALPSM